MRSVLIVSPHFPPSTLAGVHRARHLAKHLPAHGWTPIIVRADEKHYTETPDPALAKLVPASVEQIRTGAFPARIARLAGVGDIGIRAYSALRKAIEHGVRTRKPDAVIISGSPFYPMLLSRSVDRRWRLPVVLDFQDPWVSSEGAMRRKWSKGGMSHRLAVALEPRALSSATWLTSVSENHNDELAARHPWFGRARMTAIPIGGDADDFTAMRTTPPTAPAVELAAGRINLCYVGTFLPRAGPVVSALFKAVAKIRRDKPDLGDRLRLVFVGTSNQPAGTLAAVSSHRVKPLAEAAGIADVVHEHPARVSFVEAMHLQANASGLLLLGSDEPHYTASKIYPAMMSGTPYLSIFHARSSSHEILTSAGGGVAIGFDTLEALEARSNDITAGLMRLIQAPQSLGQIEPAAYAPYTAHAVAGQFARVLDKAVAAGARSGSRH